MSLSDICMAEKKKKKVFVSGVFDALHSGHVAFLKEAARYGELHVGLGSDKTIYDLKGRQPINSEEERLFMIDALECVSRVSINRGIGLLDFIDDLTVIKPEIFIVNEDGNTLEKERICQSLGIEYKVLKRIPHSNMPPRSTNTLIPYRIDLAGTWIDQPYVSKYHPGWAITASIEPTIEFNERSGMATSTRKKAIELWHNQLPMENPEKLAKILFRYENNPGTKDISGSQDSIGMTMPGINRFYYEKGEYWPSKFETINDLSTIEWLEERLYMVTLWPRPDDFVVLKETNIDEINVQRLANAAAQAWEGLKNKDIETFSKGFRQSFEAQITMFPMMMNSKIAEAIESYKDKALAWKLSGAGGGGYLILLSETPIDNAFNIKIRKKDYLV